MVSWHDADTAVAGVTHCEHSVERESVRNVGTHSVGDEICHTEDRERQRGLDDDSDCARVDLRVRGAIGSH